jgi:hypothetical protein
MYVLWRLISQTTSRMLAGIEDVFLQGFAVEQGI